MIERRVLEEIVDELELPENRVWWNYSGRHMYGRTCFGFVGGESTLARFFVALGRHQGWFDESGDDDEHPDLTNVLDELTSAVHRDDMGYETIFYFPGVEVDEEDDEDVDPDHQRDVALDAELGVV